MNLFREALRRQRELEQYERLTREPPELRRLRELVAWQEEHGVGTAPPAPVAQSIAQKRRTREKWAAAYIAEVLLATGKRITKESIGIAAGYKGKTAKTTYFLWQAGKRESETIERILREKPHLQPNYHPPKTK